MGHTKKIYRGKPKLTHRGVLTYLPYKISYPRE
jgi:hypothetical protein